MAQGQTSTAGLDGVSTDRATPAQRSTPSLPAIPGPERQPAAPELPAASPVTTEPRSRLIAFTQPQQVTSNDHDDHNHNHDNHAEHGEHNKTSEIQNPGMPTSGEMTSGYGWRWGRMHNGIDIAAPVGTDIHAWKSGRVVFSGNADDGYGNKIIIEHNDGSKTLYAHIMDGGLLVQAGQEVEQGQHVAEMGSTGFSAGPHLHFEIHVGGGAVNPLEYINTSNPLPISPAAMPIEQLTPEARAAQIQQGLVVVGSKESGFGHSEGQVITETRQLLAESLERLASEADTLGKTDISQGLRGLASRINNDSTTFDPTLEQAIKVSQVLIGITEDPANPQNLAAVVLVDSYRDFSEVTDATTSYEKAQKYTQGRSLTPDGLLGLRTHVANSLVSNKPLYVSAEDFRKTTGEKWQVGSYVNERDIQLHPSSSKQQEDEDEETHRREQASLRHLNDELNKQQLRGTAGAEAEGASL
jgi:murein DD-endopeptidase MepM/ murein hydrolase activator NlpD